MTWNDIDIDKENYRLIIPRSRSYGVSAYGYDTMLNLSFFRNSNGRMGTYGHQYANNGALAAGSTQVTALADKPSVFWNAHSSQYGSITLAGSFINQNSDHLYSVWRLASNSDVIIDTAGGNNGSLVLLNYNTGWDDQLFAVNGQGKGNTANGTSLSKVILSVAFNDFSASRPLLMSLTGGLPKNGGDIINKNDPVDAYHRAADLDYYLNYYPKYDGTSKKLLAKDDGYDWGGLQNRIQIDGSKPLPEISANAQSFVGGYSRVG